MGLILLLFVIMISAFKRMSIYTAAYGLTELRLYTTAFMLWLALTFGWFALSVLRGRRKRFLVGSLMGGVAAIAVLHIINPDSLIVQTNISRATDGASFDIKYAASLSADAVPFLVKSVGQLPTQAASELRTRLAPRGVKGESDWRSSNWSRHEASLAMEELSNAK